MTHDANLRPLGEIARVVPGRTPRHLDNYLKENPRHDRTIPFFKVGDMNAETVRITRARTYLAPDELNLLGATPLPAGTLIFPKAGGAIATNKKRTLAVDGVIDLNCMGVVASPEVEPEYLRLWFESIELSSLADGSILPQISKKRVGSLMVPVPALDEQRRIVDILEDHLSHLDGAMQEITTAVAKARNLDLSAMRRVRRTFLEAAVPQVRLGDVCHTTLGKMLDAKRANGVATPYLRNINVRWRSFDLSDVKSVQLTPAETDRLQIVNGDILVCEGGEPGRCAVWDGGSQQIAFQKALHRVRVNDASAMVPSYVALMIEETIKSGRADRLLTGTTIKHLPQEKLRLIEIPQPNIEQQRVAASHLEQLSVARERLVGEAKGVGNKCRSLRQAVLQAAFAGRLTGHAAHLQIAEEIAGV